MRLVGEVFAILKCPKLRVFNATQTNGYIAVLDVSSYLKVFCGHFEFEQELNGSA